MRAGTGAIGIALALAVAGQGASAQPVLVEFSGTVIAVTDPNGVSGGTIGLGTPVTGSYAIDPASAGQPGVTGTAYPGSSIALSAGSLDLASSLLLLVGNDAGTNGYDFIEIPGQDVAGSSQLAFGLFFLDASGTALGSEALVLAPDPGDFSTEDDVVIAGGGMEVTASIDSITVLPEPTAGLFWGVLGLAALSVRRARRPRRTPASTRGF